MTLIAISAAYGAGGTEIAPAVAQRLGVEFVDRAIPLAVAEELGVPVGDAEAHDDRMATGWLDRLLRGFIGTDTSAPTPIPAQAATSQDFRRATEEVLQRQAATGRGVILGRGASVVLRDDPRALRVRLDGPLERRIDQAMRLGGLDRITAEHAAHQLDRAHSEYVRHFYGVDHRDPALYHLMIDSTAIPLEACVELIVAAAKSRARPGAASRTRSPDGASG
jgi:cytidylate kinase